MEDKTNINSDDKMEEIFSNMGTYMVKKLKKKVESIEKRLEDVQKSDKKNKEEITTKLKELITIIKSMTEKTELQNKTQKEMFDLMENMGKLDNEIDDLLL